MNSTFWLIWVWKDKVRFVSQGTDGIFPMPDPEPLIDTVEIYVMFCNWTIRRHSKNTIDVKPHDMENKINFIFWLIWAWTDKVRFVAHITDGSLSTPDHEPWVATVEIHAIIIQYELFSDISKVQ